LMWHGNVAWRAYVFALAVAAHAAIAEVRLALRSAVDDTQAKLATETQDIGHQVRSPPGLVSPPAWYLFLQVACCVARCAMHAVRRVSSAAVRSEERAGREAEIESGPR
jgi:hypothetical protein